MVWFCELLQKSKERGRSPGKKDKDAKDKVGLKKILMVCEIILNVDSKMINVFGVDLNRKVRREIKKGKAEVRVARKVVFQVAQVKANRRWEEKEEEKE